MHSFPGKGNRSMRRAVPVGLAIALIAPLALVAHADEPGSAPDRGRAFIPTPVSQPLYDIQPPTDENGQRLFIEAADGTPLFLEVYLPRARLDGPEPPERVPTVLVMTPYAQPGEIELTPGRVLNHLVPRGYAFAISHVRGMGGSGGCFQFRGPREVDDGSRLVEWLAREAPWSDGKVGTFGLSYHGGTAIGVATRGDAARYVKAVVALAPYSSVYDYLQMDGVKLFLRQEVFTADFQLRDSVARSRGPHEAVTRSSCFHENLVPSADQGGGVTRYYRERDDRVALENLTAATLLMHGWTDPNVRPTVVAGLFDKIPESTPKAGVFGVWGHEDPGHRASSGLHPEWARGDYLDMVTAWFDHYLKGLDAGADRWPVAQVQSNDGQWRTELDWPTTGGPVGQLALGPSGQLGVSTPNGSTTYTEALENRATGSLPGTAAVFETGPLPGRLQIAGQPVVDLWVRLDRPDAHLAARLETFGPDGERLGTQTRDEVGLPIDTGATLGLRSAQHLDPLVANRFWQSEAKPPPVGVPVRVQLRFDPAELVIPEGGTIRLTVAGSLIVSRGLEPVFEGPSAPSGSFTRVEILHDCEHPSALRFLMPRRTAELLNVREIDEPPEEPLADSPRSRNPRSDGGRLARAPVCGERPIRLPSHAR